MTTYSSRITTGSNDAYDSNDAFPGASVTSTTLFIGPTAASEIMVTGFIHEDVNIPAGSTINSCTLQVQRSGFDSSGNEVIDTVVMKESGTPTTFNTTTQTPRDQYDAGGITTATVGWNMGADGGDNDPEVTPDLAALVQEVVDTVGDVTDLMTLIRDTGAGALVAVVYAFENATTGRSALLDIDFTEGAGGGAAVSEHRVIGRGINRGIARAIA